MPIDTSRPDLVVWQRTDEEPGVPEPPILVKRYNDVIALTQEERSINVNPKTVADLVTALRRAAKMEFRR